MDNFMTFCFPFLEVLPFSYLRYYPFRDKLIFPMKKIMLLLTGLTFLEALFFLYLNHQPWFGAGYMTLFRYFFLIFFAVLSFLLIRDSFGKKMFIYTLLFTYACCIFANANFIQSHFFTAYGEKHPYTIYNLLRILQMAITFPFVFYALKHYICYALAIDHKHIWTYIWMVPLMFSGLGVLYCSVLDPYASASWQFLFSRYLMVLGAFFTSIVLFKTLEETKKNVLLEETLKYMDKLLQVQKAQYENIVDYMNTARSANHNLRQHLTVLRSLVEKNNIHAVTEYLEEYAASLPSITYKTFCENHAVDAILNHYYGIAQKQGIHFDCSLFLPEAFSILTTDLCILLGNLLENAVDACKEQKGAHRFLTIKAEPVGTDMFVILVENSFEGSVLEKDKTFFSTKHTGEGIGIASIKSIINKYHGTLQIDYQNHIFKSHIFLNPKDIKAKSYGQMSI